MTWLSILKADLESAKTSTEQLSRLSLWLESYVRNKWEEVKSLDLDHYDSTSQELVLFTKSMLNDLSHFIVSFDRMLKEIRNELPT